MNKNIIFWISIVLLILLGIFGPGLLRRKAEYRSQPANEPSQPMSGAMVVKGFNYGFSPQTITVKQGDMVMIQLVSDDSPHTFTIDELGVNQEFTWGKDASVTFTASRKGTFQYYCSVPGHKEGGMIGSLIVE